MKKATKRQAEQFIALLYILLAQFGLGLLHNFTGWNWPLFIFIFLMIPFFLILIKGKPKKTEL